MLLRIKAKPNSKKDEIIREADGTFKVKIKAPPIDGKANEHLIIYLASVLSLPKSKITLFKGETTVFKTLEIEADEKYVTDILSKL